MIIELLCTPLWLIISGIITIIPDNFFDIGSTPSNLISMLSTALSFFPNDVWVLALGSITFWISVHFVYAIINFILKLIPLLNIGQG